MPISFSSAIAETTGADLALRRLVWTLDSAILITHHGKEDEKTAMS